MSRDARDGEYGRAPCPPDKWVEETLRREVLAAQMAVDDAHVAWMKAEVDAKRAGESHLRWVGRLAHMEAALAAHLAMPASPPPPSPPPADEVDVLRAGVVQAVEPPCDGKPGTIWLTEPPAEPPAEPVTLIPGAR